MTSERGKPLMSEKREGKGREKERRRKEEKYTTSIIII